MIISLIEIEISIPISVLTWIPWKKLSSPLDPPYCEIFKIRNTDLEFGSPRYVWHKHKNKKNTSNCKALCLSRKCKKCFLKHLAFISYAPFLLWIVQSILILNNLLVITLSGTVRFLLFLTL